MASNESYKRRRKWKTGPPMCSFFLRGKCKNDVNCKFSHEAVAKDKSNVPVCPYWARRECRYGDGCTFKHDTDDVDVLTERYNAQLLAAASMELQYVYDPTTGTTYPVQASSEYAPAAQPYYPGSAPALNPAYPTLPVSPQAVIPGGQPYPSLSSPTTFLAPGTYQPESAVATKVEGFQSNPNSLAPMYPSNPNSLAPMYPPPRSAKAFPDQAVSNVYPQPLGSNVETVQNSSTRKRKREVGDGDAGSTALAEGGPYSPSRQRRRFHETNVREQ